MSLALSNFTSPTIAIVAWVGFVCFIALASLTSVAVWNMIKKHQEDQTD